MKRKGLGRGLGKGYKNIVPRDPYVHGLSARGVSTQLKMDKSRLKNLMREYRDHIITRSWERQPHKQVVQVVEEVDDARRTLEFGLSAKGTWKANYVPTKNPKYEYVWGGDVFDDDNEGLLYGVEDVTDFPEYIEWFSSWEEREKNSKAGKMNIVNREQHYDYLKRNKILDAKGVKTKEKPVYNVWVSIERIREKSEDSGTDLQVKKVGKYKSFKKAEEKFESLDAKGRREKWKKVDETPYQDKANELVIELKEEDPDAEYDVRMKYGKIRDPSRPLFEIWKR